MQTLDLQFIQRWVSRRKDERMFLNTKRRRFGIRRISLVCNVQAQKWRQTAITSFPVVRSIYKAERSIWSQTPHITMCKRGVSFGCNKSTCVASPARWRSTGTVKQGQIVSSHIDGKARSLVIGEPWKAHLKVSHFERPFAICAGQEKGWSWGKVGQSR